MSSLCSIHGVPLTGVFLSCPACKADERKQEELLGAQEAAAQLQTEAVERQTELLRHSSEDEAERALEAQMALNEVAAATKARLEDDRRHRELEETRATMRAGVRELHPALQQQWLALNAAVDQVRAESKADCDSLDQLKAERKKREAAYNASFESFRDATIPSARDQLNRPSGSVIESLPENTIAVGENAERLASLMHTVARCAAVYSPDAATWGGCIPSRATSLWPMLNGLREVAASIKPPKESHDYSQDYGCLAFIPHLVLAGIVFSVLSSMLGNSALIVVFSLGVPIALSVLWQARKKAAISRYEEFQRALQEFCRALSEALAIKSANPDSLIGALLQHFAGGLVKAGRSDAPQREPYVVARRDLESLVTRIQDAEKAFEVESARRSAVVKKYSYLRAEILRVGREIVEGIRAPGRFLFSANCSRCGGPITSETTRCPYCGGGEPSAAPVPYGAV